LEQNGPIWQHRANLGRRTPLFLGHSRRAGDRARKAKNKAESVDGGKMVKNSVESIFGINAGIVWKALNKENGPMAIDDLIKVTYLKREEIYGALGWLGRENKISVETCGNIRYFSRQP
jgi:hypothetical protein